MISVGIFDIYEHDKYIIPRGLFFSILVSLAIKMSMLNLIEHEQSFITSCPDDSEWNMMINILRRKSLVSTDTVCNNFVRQSWYWQKPY